MGRYRYYRRGNHYKRCWGFKLDQSSSVAPSLETGWKITHLGYLSSDIRQQYVQYAYDVGWMDLVTLIECENWQRKTTVKWDSGKAIGLCQMHTSYHKLPDMYYTDRRFQVDYCNGKMEWGTKFYWPSRQIKGMRCSTYVLDRFKIE